MKNSLCFLGVFVLFASAILFSCADTSKMHDLDNTIEEAVLLDFDEIVEIKVQPVGNRNWFKVEVPEQGYVRVSSQVSPEDVNLSCYFAFYEEWEDDKINRITGHLSFPAITKVSEGTYHFVVYDRWNNSESDEIIPLRVEFIEEFDPYERNHESEDAKEISLDTEFQTAVFPEGDRNWFRTKVDTAGIIKLMGRNIDNIDLIAEFYEYDEWSTPKVNKISSTLHVPCGFAVHEPGEYYFRLRDRWDKKYSQELIDMKIEFLLQNDKFEPNDHFTQAAEIKDGDILNIAIFPKGDIDYFKIIPEKSGELSLRVRGNTGSLELTSRLYTVDPEDASELVSESDRVSLPGKFEVNKDEEYYFYIKDRWDKNQLEDLFEVKVEIL